MVERPPALLPDDEHNRLLEHAVAPPAWTNPTPLDQYHLVVIGAGTAGLVTAAGAAGLGAKVALIEASLMGGDCLNYGCVPSKAIIASARKAHAIKRAQEFGIEAHSPKVDFAAVMQRMRRLRAGLSHHDSAERFASLGVHVFRGMGKFTSPSTVTVNGMSLRFRTAVIATGGRADVPEISGLREAGYLTNETVFSLTELPRRLVVLGAGPIGCELAQVFARLGSEVTQITHGPHILSKEDPDARALVQQQMERDGVRFVLNGTVQQVSKQGDAKLLTVKQPQGNIDIVADAILIATGRVPNVQSLDLDAAGVKYDRKLGVQVNDYLQTSNANVYAAGDVCSRYQFTHSADFYARIVIRNSLFLGWSRASSLVIPWCTYTSPEVAQVGVKADEASKQGLAIDTFTQPLSGNDRAVLDDATNGFVRIHVRRGTDRIVGATIVAEHAGDLIGELTLAMTHGIGLKKIAATIHPYPTTADAIRRVGDQYNRTRLSPFVKWLFKAWLGG